MVYDGEALDVLANLVETLPNEDGEEQSKRDLVDTHLHVGKVHELTEELPDRKLGLARVYILRVGEWVLQ